MRHKMNQGKRAALALALGLTMAPTAQAEGPATGCFARDYSDAHLAGAPQQVVDQIALRIYRQDGGALVAALRVLTADQGHVKQWGLGGQRFDQFLLCGADSDGAYCSVECDGGSMDIIRQDAGGLTFRTRYLMVGDTGGCGGAVDLAEVPGQDVAYRLDRVADSACAGMK